MSAVRVTFQRNDDANEGMHIDIVLNGAQVKKGTDYFGVWYDNTEGTKCPFILKTDGQLDYGPGYEDEDQYYDTTLLDTNFAPGSSVTVTFEDEVIGYKIASITPLA
jgi:hypothetical protein